MLYRGKFVDPPRSASHRRPGDRPYYIPNACVVCGGPLVYSHPWDWTLDEDADGKMIHRPVTDQDPVWFDSFICPQHTGDTDLHYLDWPQAELDALEASAQGRAYPSAKWRYLKRVGMVDHDYRWVGRPRKRRARRG